MADEIIEQLKTCAKCGETKAVRRFYPRRSKPGIFSDNCRQCRKPMQMKRSLSDRFWEKVDKSPGQGPQGDCWEWTASRNDDGYGMIGRPSPVGAHRVSWELHNGPIPKGQHALHRCDNPPCVNPDHLFLGTKKANFDDMIQKRREGAKFREEMGKAKLTADQVREARALYASGECSQVELATRFNVALATMNHAINGRYWKHVI